MQLDGTPVPRLPDNVPGLPAPESSRPSYHEALRVAHEVHATTMARGKHRHGGTASAVISGVVLMALLVAGFLAINHYVWSRSDGNADGTYLLETQLFSVALPAKTVEISRSEVILGVTASVLTRTAQTATVSIAVVMFDLDMVAPGGTEDPLRVDRLRQSGHDAVVIREGVGAQPSIATEVDGRPALVTTTVEDGRAFSVTTVLNRSMVISFVCHSAGVALPPECAAALDSVNVH